MRTVLFGGAYGIRSQGDDAALLVLVEGLRRRLGDFDGVVIARHAYEDAYRPYGLRSVQNLEYDSKAESVGRWFRGFNYGDDRQHLEELVAEMARADLLVLGAGNALIDLTIDLLRGPIPYFVILTIMAKTTGTPVMWFGLSVGPLRTEYGRRLSRLAADLADVITVRDSHSIVELDQIGVERALVQLPDPVLGLRPRKRALADQILQGYSPKSGSRGFVAVSTRDMPVGIGPSTGDFVEVMASVCDTVVSRFNLTPVFVPHSTYERGYAEEDDRNIAQLVVGQMRNSNVAVLVKDHLTVEQCLSLYGIAKAAVCARLHANVYAAIQGVPPVALCYAPKVAAFMNWLDRDDLAVDLTNFSPDPVLKRLEFALADRTELSKAVRARVESGRRRVERYADIAAEMLAAGRRPG